MKKYLIIIKAIALLLVLIFSTGFLSASGDVVALAQLRLYEGFKVDAPAPAKVITSYYLKPLAQKDVLLNVATEKEKASLKKVFNLKDIKLITEAYMVLLKGMDKFPFEVIILNGRKMLLQLSPVEGEKDRFKVDVLEKGKKSRSLLQTKFLLPEKKTTVLGFEDSAGKTYFLSFHRDKNLALERSRDVVRNAVNIKAIEKPKLIKSPAPKYPKEALKAGIDGTIVIDAVSDTFGRVVEANVVSGPPELRMAALGALKQWVYEPYIKDGKPTPVRFTVVVKFNLKKKGKEGKPVQVSSEQRPKLIKNPQPIYPQSAIDNHIQGKVVIEAVTDTYGRVMSAKILDGPPELRQASLDAIKQWVYEPYIVDGVVKPVSFTVIMKFNLDKDKKKKGSSLKPVILSSDQKPKCIKRVNPKYPKEALKAGIDGMVALEITIDKKGWVTAAKIIDGHELLSVAALAAVNQWKFEPYYMDGEPHFATFTVTIKFNLHKKNQQAAGPLLHGPGDFLCYEHRLKVLRVGMRRMHT